MRAPKTMRVSVDRNSELVTLARDLAEALVMLHGAIQRRAWTVDHEDAARSTIARARAARPAGHGPGLRLRPRAGQLQRDPAGGRFHPRVWAKGLRGFRRPGRYRRQWHPP